MGIPDGTRPVQDSSSNTSSSHLHLRQSYASAIIRFVNGFVDPLQLGAYARSIASIAAQLQLPAWLVELRHAATHEDLPSLEVLREAARDAMGWLLHNYFLPSLNPSMPAPSQAPSLRPITPLLKQYKSLLKATSRDTSLRSRYKPEITKVFREVERWISEAKVAADVSGAMLDWGADNDDSNSEEDGREQWAIEKKKSRLELVIHTSANLPSILTAKIVAHITMHKPQEEDSAEGTITFAASNSAQDVSFDTCIASWAHWLVRTFGSAQGDDDDGSILRRDEVVVQLASDLGPLNHETAVDTKAARLLLDKLCAEQPYLHRISSLIGSTSSEIPSWSAKDLNTMELRLESFISSHVMDTPTDNDMVESHMPEVVHGPRLPRGWQTVSLMGGWKPTPIGM
ncbi:hypothetical protein EIP86_009857 [Pleurotus ostreatoroseus]|nr:hypothetical protein EIP86_009857 [Pleurotus ostreatoroseus]